MLGRAKTWWIPLLLGLLSGLVVLGSLLVIGTTLLRMQVAISDFVFLADRGPQLGRLPANDQIVLVHYDETSRQEMGVLPTYDDDLALYRLLLNAGAKVIADTRMVADGGGEETLDIRQFLEKMVSTRAEGRLFRDIWIASQLPVEFLESVEPYIANNLLNMHPNTDSFYEARIYPLAMILGERFRESIPLILARATRGLQRFTSAEVVAQLKACGISAAWQENLAEGLALREELRADGVEMKQYPLGDESVPWLLFSSNSPSVLTAGYWVSYAWPPADFPRVSYCEASKAAAAEQFADKIVLIGYEATIDQLNSLLKILVDCTFANEGTVDKFIGDAILVLFNAPLDQPDHASKAARTALAMQAGIAQHPSGLTVGIGIHQGEAVVGRVGTPERMEYTAVGSTVNVASRLCSTAASGTIVVSDAVAEAIEAQAFETLTLETQALGKNGFQLFTQPPIRVKGVAAELQTFLLRG
jgi:adenylate cyclase